MPGVIPHSRATCRLVARVGIVDRHEGKEAGMSWRQASFALVVFGAMVIAPPLAKSTGTWVRDADGNCAIWNAEPRPNESFSWSGSCEAGLASGEGVLQWYQDDEPTERYEGLMSSGKPHGLGVVTLPGGEQHQAPSVEGVFHGEGRVSWPDGVYCKVNYASGEIDGQVFCYHPNGDVTAHLFERGQQIRRDRENIVADEN